MERRIVRCTDREGRLRFGYVGVDVAEAPAFDWLAVDNPTVLVTRLTFSLDGRWGYRPSMVDIRRVNSAGGVERRIVPVGTWQAFLAISQAGEVEYQGGAWMVRVAYAERVYHPLLL